MVTDGTSLEQFKKQFKEELAGISDVGELQEVYARELAKRDKLIAKLQAQNDLLLKTAFKQKEQER